MDIFNLLNMIGGLALFLYGMNIMGNGLSKMAGGKLETILEKLTTKRIFAVLLGAGVTAVIQSSSATTVMVKKLTNPIKKKAVAYYSKIANGYVRFNDDEQIGIPLEVYFSEKRAAIEIEYGLKHQGTQIFNLKK